jgi:c-di-GMP-binding flagellar brake protein YcgR
MPSISTDNPFPPGSPPYGNPAVSGVDGCDVPVLDEVDLFEPDPVWVVDEPSRVLLELHNLQQSGSVCVLRPQGDPELVAQLVAVDEPAGRIAWRLCGALPDLGSLLQRGEASVEATFGRIDLLFRCAEFQPAGDDALLLSSRLPVSIRRIQRREVYRLRMRAYSRGGPRVQLRPPQGSDPVRVRLLDLSVGGCGLLLPKGLEVDWVGTLFRSARVELDPSTVLMTSLRVLWQQKVREPDSLACRIRLGCCWQELSATNERTIQVHLDAVQRQRRMLMKDRT